jgi:hypothetical protein
MKLAGYQRIMEGDFKEEDKDLVRTLSPAINDGFSDIQLALNNRLTFADNFNCTTRVLDITVNAYGVPTDNLTITLDRVSGSSSVNTKAYGAQILRAVNLTNTTVYPTATPFISFSQNGANVLKIDHVAGIPAGNKFRLNLVIFNQ